MDKVDLNSDDWKQIPCNRGQYYVSKQGQVYNAELNRLLMLTVNHNGYLVVSVPNFTRPGANSVLLHRLVAMVFIPNPDNKPHINHKDANKTNANVDNLEWCTVAENRVHMVAMGIHHHYKYAVYKNGVHLGNFNRSQLAGKSVGLHASQIVSLGNGRAQSIKGFTAIIIEKAKRKPNKIKTI